MGVSYDLTCWYLNARRITELTRSIPSAGLGGSDEQLQRLARFRDLKDSVVDWMSNADPQPLGVMLARGEPEVGRVFTCHSNFYFSGLGKVHDALRKGRTPKNATAYTKLDEWRQGGRLAFEFHHEHLTSNSSWTELAGQKRVFILGLITDVRDTEISAVPYVIANIVDPASDFATTWTNHLEVHVTQIDAFAKIRDMGPMRLTKASLNPLKLVSETEVKTAIAELINEPMVPKDWGGESSDLFSSRLEVDGKRVSTAFLLKGPAKFHPMTPSDLGKNGDQIGRLFDEPADLLVLQHCHEITTAVRKQMRAYAQQMKNPRRFCIIDGYDTVRLLSAYGLCGFSGAPLARGALP